MEQEHSPFTLPLVLGTGDTAGADGLHPLATGDEGFDSANTSPVMGLRRTTTEGTETTLVTEKHCIGHVNCLHVHKTPLTTMEKPMISMTKVPSIEEVFGHVLSCGQTKASLSFIIDSQHIGRRQRQRTLSCAGHIIDPFLTEMDKANNNKNKREQEFRCLLSIYSIGCRDGVFDNH